MTNTLQTLANKNQQVTNWLPTSRKSQMIYLAALIGITLIGQYALLGTAGLGEDASTLPDWFFVTEKILWGLRGLVEVAVVVYVGMTQHKTTGQTALLWIFKAILIILIVLTVGPVWGAHALNVDLVDILGRGGVIAWGALLAGISAVMLAAVSYAYVVQPTNEECYILPLVDFEKMLAVVGEAELTATRARQAADEALMERDRALAEFRGMREAVAILRLLPPSAQVQVVALFANGRPAPETLAEEFRLSPSTIRGVYAKLE